MNESKNKNLLTWKDADQNLCTIACYILHTASVMLRSPRQAGEWHLGEDANLMLTSHPVEGGGRVQAGYAEDNSQRTWWSGALPNAFRNTVEISVSPQCWWSFQNLVKYRLKMARKELMENRYMRIKEPKTSIQFSRNPTGRKKWRSKFGRQPERE